MANVTVDASEFAAFFSRTKQAARGDFKRELELFLQELGTKFLSIVQDEIMRRGIIDERQLLSGFQQGDKEGVWETSDGGLTLEVGTNVSYAAFVNDGHWTNPQGVEKRFVPGHWRGKRFIYDPNAKTGMVLKQKWVDGKHYWESAIRIFEKIFPELLDAKLQQWLDRYFGGL